MTDLSSTDPQRPRGGFDFRAFISFRQMITPAIITGVYVIGFVLITIGALVQITSNALIAVLFWVVAQIYLRVILELFMVLFRINDSLATIERRGRGL